MSNFEELEKWDRSHFFHPSTHLAQFSRGDIPQRIITGGSGVYITDQHGDQYLDAFAGLYCVNVGYGRPEIVQAMSRQAKALSYYHSYVGHGTEASVRLSKMIIDRAPKNMSHVYYGLSGSDANETNIKLVWFYNNVLGRPNKKKIISRWRGYHGSGLMTGSLTGLDLFHNQFDLPLPQVIHTDAPYYYWREDEHMSESEFSKSCAQSLENLILEQGPDTIAAFIGEPALGTGGLVPPPAEYWADIQKVLRRYDVLLIADEVVTGFGRLGSMFGSMHYDITADIITCAKGLTSAYAPLSASIVSADMWSVLERGTEEFGVFGHGWTYSAHPLGVSAGVANLQLVDELNLVANARDIGTYLRDGFDSAFGDHRHVGEIRGEGLLVAIEFVSDKEKRTRFEPEKGVGAKLSAALLQRGVIARAMPQGDILGFAPPLCLTANEADIIIEATAEALSDVFDQRS